MTKSAGNAANADDAPYPHPDVILCRALSAKPLVRHKPRWHPVIMTRDLVNRHCATLPGALRSDPWGGGHDAWKVGDKMFAVVGAMEDHGVAVKCPDVETAALLIEMGRALPAPYFHKSWIRMPWGLVSNDEMIERLTASYRIIRSGLSKKRQAALG